MSTFSGLNTAYTALVAARQGLDVVGQNISNVNTVGYTRQRAVQTAAGSLAQVGPLAAPAKVGQGVTTSSISRLGDAYLDQKVRTSVASSGYWGVRATELTSLQASLHEPGKNGISAQLQTVWAAWHDMGNHPGDAATAAVLLQQSSALTTQIATGYSDVSNQWSQLRSSVGGMATELNDAASQVAGLNGLIRSTIAAGGSANELIDQRSTLTITIATLTGATVRNLPDGTAEVLVGGNTLVSGDKSYAVTVSGANTLARADADPVRLSWVDRPTVPVSLDGGELAGAVSVLAGANGSGTGGALAEAAADYNDFATYLAKTVNAVHSTGVTSGPLGHSGLDFFAIDGSVPAALGIRVVPTDVAGVATGAVGQGGLSGSIAAAISQIGTSADSPDKIWSAIVTGIGISTRTGLQQSTLADLSTGAAVGNQLANSSVDMDEENVNMLTFQTAYQGAARVMTAVDEMLDTLINRTGLVGR
ncbi:MAG: flagellar hook-associated protein FlgK [Microbacteriaceae bacterium]|nr:flagellar hook-associated protein FlgK [Microbacteriaceae bacterium]